MKADWKVYGTPKSGIISYRFYGASFQIRYKTGKVFQYTASDNSKEIIEQMKKLAKAGSGLSRYISGKEFVRERKMEYEMVFPNVVAKMK